MKALFPEDGRYTLGNICGALVPESLAALRAHHPDAPKEDLRQRALEGTLFAQRSWQARRRLWHAVHARYLRYSAPWALDDLIRAASRGPGDPSARGLLYLYFAMRDRLTFDWITGPIWDRWTAGKHRLTRNDVLADLTTLLASQQVQWKENSRKKHATSLLSALRDYGLAHGVQVKRLQRPILTNEVSAHLLRLLIDEGVAGAALIDHRAWRLLLRTPDEVAAELAALALDGLIRFERAGSTVVLETPWSLS